MEMSTQAAAIYDTVGPVFIRPVGHLSLEETL